MDDLTPHETSFYLNCIRTDFVTKVMGSYKNTSFTYDLFVDSLSPLMLNLYEIDLSND